MGALETSTRGEKEAGCPGPGGDDTNNDIGVGIPLPTNTPALSSTAGGRILLPTQGTLGRMTHAVQGNGQSRLLCAALPCPLQGPRGRPRQPGFPNKSYLEQRLQVTERDTQYKGEITLLILSY